MRVGWLMSVMVLLASVWAAEGAPAPGAGSAVAAESTEAAPETTDESQKLSEIESAYSAGKYDQTIELATPFLRTAKDTHLKARAARAVADSLRKKKDWSRASSAYLMLRDRFKKGSDEYVRYHAMADILRASPTGVYGQAVGEDGEPKPASGPSLDDDAAVAAALSRRAAARAEKLRLRIIVIKEARTAQDVIERFAPVAVELRQLRVLWPEMPPNLDREAIQGAGMRMARVAGKVVAGLKSKQAVCETLKESKRVTMGLRKQMLRWQGICYEMARAETSLAAGMDMLSGMSGWAEGEQLKADCAARRQTFEELAKAFVPPELTGRSGGRDTWRDSRSRDRGGAGGGAL